jgi:aspartyl/asparaginyl beta-hydroxylase (cupin superfamily)
MTLTEQQDFLKNLIDNTDVIINEYINSTKRGLPLPDWDENATLLQNWRAVALWWDYKPWPFTQKKFPKTTELIRTGPSHKASSFLILDSNSKTPTHNHINWGKKIIVHLPIVIPEGDSGFVVEDKIYNWKVGELFAFDATKNHHGYNNTNCKRCILILDFDADEWREALEPYMAN